MSQRLKNKVAIITGGARGIGEGCVRTFSNEGATVIIADIRRKESQTLCESIEKGNGKAVYIETDVTNSQSIQHCILQTVRQFGKLDILLNNAGTHFPHSIDELTEERWDFLLSLNLKSMFLFCKPALPHLRKTKGSIVNMSSIRGLIGQENAVAYCASKAGILGFTRGLARDESKTGVRVNAVCPSCVETPLMEEWIEKQKDPQTVRQQVVDLQPIGRMGTIEEIGRVAVFLASEDASFITGTQITADGGALLD